MQAKVGSTSVYGTGLLDVQAQSNEKIAADIIAVSASVAGGTAGVAIAAGGTWVDNQSDVATSALIDGGSGGATIKTGAVTVEADDLSTIDALALAGALSGAFGGGGAAIAVGVSIAANGINDPVTASIANINLLSTGSGAVGVTANENATIDANRRGRGDRDQRFGVCFGLAQRRRRFCRKHD